MTSYYGFDFEGWASDYEQESFRRFNEEEWEWYVAQEEAYERAEEQEQSKYDRTAD